MAKNGQIDEPILSNIPFDCDTYGWLELLLRLSIILHSTILDDLTNLLLLLIDPNYSCSFQSYLLSKQLDMYISCSTGNEKTNSLATALEIANNIAPEMSEKWNLDEIAILYSLKVGWEVKLLLLVMTENILKSKSSRELAHILKDLKYFEGALVDENSNIRCAALQCLITSLDSNTATQLGKLDLSVHSMLLQEKESSVIKLLLDYVAIKKSQLFTFSDLLQPPPDYFARCLQNEDYSVRESYVSVLQMVIESSLEIEEELHAQWYKDFLSLIDDPSRIVRLKVLLALQKLTTSYQYKTKRQAATLSNSFLLDCQNLDLETLILRCQPEELYSEDFDMGDDIIDEADERGEGNNVLFCYDC
ncbi:hypothetical protein HDV06_003722 [Boothiomyces sp. JEL0866]|nr:hypothetical protein HDV06_003706 [Boothiomyces sp. JEL0866]KAJ3321985.1 hypothetical protein HDV06_003722 [Boothiomyces sp. JEL0866]